MDQRENRTQELMNKLVSMQNKTGTGGGNDPLPSQAPTSQLEDDEQTRLKSKSNSGSSTPSSVLSMSGASKESQPIINEDMVAQVRSKLEKGT